IDAATKVTIHMHSPYFSCSKRHRVEDLIAMLGAMEAVVAMRLHALILATSGGTPVVGISYDVKVDSFIKDIGSTACIELEQLTVTGLCAEIDKALGDNGRSRASKAAALLRQREQINIEEALWLINQTEAR
ncbi:MAG: polysaccharide pyruvyl transferase family protein, partial [Clostridiales bacterium]